MINRRRVLRSFLSLAAAGAASRTGWLFGGQPALPGHLQMSGTSAATESSRTLAEMLREAIELCRTMKESSFDSQQLCAIALARAQRSVNSSPAFWQACSDSISRLEAAVSRRQSADFQEVRTTARALCQLGNLKKRLINQTNQVIGSVGRPV